LVVIERFYLRNCLTFDEVELELGPGLIVFSGPSGSGKSVLMRSILGSVGFEDALAELSESTVNWQVDEGRTGFVNEESNVLKQVKKEKVRYFLNAQTISKRSLKEIAKEHLKHLSLKDYSDFEQENLLEILDRQIMLKEPDYADTIDLYKKEYAAYKKAQHSLELLLEEEKRIADLKEFAEFELAKINEINPAPEEYEHLLELKRALSRKEKSEEKITEAEAMFQLEHTVTEALAGLDIDTAFFDDAMNELRVQFDAARSAFDEVENIDVEEVLDRLEQLSGLKRRYGSIEEAIAYRDQKAKEVQKYENFEAEKSDLQHEVDRLYTLLVEMAGRISVKRSETLYDVNESVNAYLKQLYLGDAELTLTHGDFVRSGQDRVAFNLKGTSLEKISSGEFNRLRLALLAVKSESMKEQGGVLMLDEIDANLSGEESMSVARVLRRLSRHFQIFVISHQPQLTSMGDQHFLVTKNGTSSVQELEVVDRVLEIARMVSGETITDEALVFAKELLESAR
jgi:DNA repair protein RecN (Recombination protein N)